MNHNQQETQRGPGGKRHRQEDVPSRTEKKAREENRGRENFTKPPAYDSSKQPDVTTEPERLSAKEKPKSEAQREKLRHPPAQRSDRG